MKPNIEETLFSKRVIDNRQLKMTDTLKYLLSKADTQNLDIAVGYFYLSGLLLIKEEFIDFMTRQNGHFRILMGNETNGLTLKLLDYVRQESFEQYIEDQSDDDVKNISDKKFLEMIASWLAQGRIEVRIYTGEANYFHAKSYLFAQAQNSSNGYAIVGSSNFSKNGLEGNTELNVLSQDNYLALHQWFDLLWNSEDEVKEFSPNLINIVKSTGGVKEIHQEYVSVAETYYGLARLYSHAEEELDPSEKWVEKLFPHQRSGAVLIKERLDSYGTAVLADGVGLGKTRTAAAVIKMYLNILPLNEHILILADRKLHTQWKEELGEVGVSLDRIVLVSKEKLNREGIDFLVQQKYPLVVVDEAHQGFKNNNTNAYKLFRSLKEQQPKVKGLMLTATPWNNKREDVINIGTLFMDMDGIPNDRNYKQYFIASGGRLTNKFIRKMATDDVAFNQFWTDIYLQRTRKTYGGKGARFPEREFPTVDIPYEPQKNQIFSDNFESISRLHLPYMDPIRYIEISKNQLGANQLKLFLLKRSDSSWVAFESSLENIKSKLESVKKGLEGLDAVRGTDQVNRYMSFIWDHYELDGYRTPRDIDLLLGMGALKDDMEENDIDIKSRIERQKYFDRIEKTLAELKADRVANIVSKMMSDTNQDLTTVNLLIKRLKEAYKNIDEKLDSVLECLDQERELGHKVIIVSQFSDTVDYYYEKIFNRYNSEKITYPMGKVTGNNNDDAVLINQMATTKKDVLDHFSPRSKNQLQLIDSDDEINLIVATDTISTGQNLQDAVTVMNLDLPYNPMQLEQRIGRIDRPRKDGNSERIYIYTFPVYESIASQLKMAERLGEKMEGILSDTEFDNVVLPEYKGYLERAKKEKGAAVKKMLDDFTTHITYNSGMSAEEHTEEYRLANRRMYNYMLKGVARVKNPLIPNVSFSNGKDKSVVVIRVQFKDVNKQMIATENVIVNAESTSKIGLVEAEKNIFEELRFDQINSTILPLDQAQMLLVNTKNDIKKVLVKLVSDYNAQQSQINEGINTLEDKVSKKAAKKLKDGARENPVLAKQKMLEVGLEPNMLGKLAAYITTIAPEDDLYDLVKEIASNPNIFWLHLEQYAEFFKPQTIEEATRISDAKKKIDIRKADIDASNFEILLGNIVVPQ
ncbi:type III restriction endonuclease subunit R [Limosilactobacillus fermentum]|uniref:helicase-related protein n=2 Tax=Limosilactobacillus fermentum TaxID=1613 RepID=UPI001BCB7AE3|nr:phospholipase D-like domain-containing protein [Limosilactobacillus fermentum]MBS7688786.1 type III restriction endonuclease subunit R [Limosilactobacillus fermentum]